jgi:uncharacterized protein DUF350
LNFMTDLVVGLGTGVTYGLLGIALLVLGFIALDLVTPGDLRTIVWVQRCWNAALVVASGVVAIGAIVTTSIVTSEDEFLRGLATAAGYGLLGIALLGLSFWLIDRLTPGDLGAMLSETDRHPAVYVTVGAHLAVGAIVAAAIS